MALLLLTRNCRAAAAQAFLDNLIERGLDPKAPRLFILDGAKALSKAVRATFGR
jgi:putative transposase